MTQRTNRWRDLDEWYMVSACAGVATCTVTLEVRC